MFERLCETIDGGPVEPLSVVEEVVFEIWDEMCLRGTIEMKEGPTSHHVEREIDGVELDVCDRVDEKEVQRDLETLVGRHLLWRHKGAIPRPTRRNGETREHVWPFALISDLHPWGTTPFACLKALKQLDRLPRLDAGIALCQGVERKPGDSREATTGGVHRKRKQTTNDL